MEKIKPSAQPPEALPGRPVVHEHTCNDYCAPDSGMDSTQARALTMDVSTSGSHFEKQGLLSRLAGDLRIKPASGKRQVFP